MRNTKSTVIPHNNTLYFDRRQIDLNNSNDNSDDFECLLTEIETDNTLIEDQIEHEWNFDEPSYVPQPIIELSTEENTNFQTILNYYDDISLPNL